MAIPPPGAAVKLRGLVTHPAWNDSLGVVNDKPFPDTHKTSPGRIPVVVHMDGQLQEAHLKLENLAPSTTFPHWFASTQPMCPCGSVHMLDKGEQVFCTLTKQTTASDEKPRAAAGSGSSSSNDPNRLRLRLVAVGAMAVLCMMIWKARR